MKIVYDGPQPTRTVQLAPGKDITFEKGEPTEVPKEVGEKLVRQRHFAEATAGSSTPPAAPAKTSASTSQAPDPSASAEKRGE